MTENRSWVTRVSEYSAQPDIILLSTRARYLLFQYSNSIFEHDECRRCGFWYTALDSGDKLQTSADCSVVHIIFMALGPVSIKTQSLALRALRALRKRKPQETQALASRNKRKRQPIGMIGRSSGNHNWLLANASACVSCGFRLLNARNARNASDCVLMETGV